MMVYRAATLFVSDTIPVLPWHQRAHDPWIGPGWRWAYRANIVYCDNAAILTKLEGDITGGLKPISAVSLFEKRHNQLLKEGFAHP